MLGRLTIREMSPHAARHFYGCVMIVQAWPEDEEPDSPLMLTETQLPLMNPLLYVFA